MEIDAAADPTSIAGQVPRTSGRRIHIQPDAPLEDLLSLLVGDAGGPAVTTGVAASQGTKQQQQDHDHQRGGQVPSQNPQDRQDLLLQILSSLGISKVRDFALLSTGESSSTTSTSPLAGKTFGSIVIDAGNAFLKQWRSVQQAHAAGSSHHDHHDDLHQDTSMGEDKAISLLHSTEEEALNEFIRQLTRLHSSAIDALSPPLLTGADFLAQDLLAASGTEAHDDKDVQDGQRICLPLSVSRLVMAGSAPYTTPTSRVTQTSTSLDRVNLCAPNEVIQISGTKGSGRKTLVLHSVLASLHANPGVHALWIGVPSLAPASSTSSSSHSSSAGGIKKKEEEEEDGVEGQQNAFEKLLLERSAAMRHHVAVKALTAWSTLQELHKIPPATDRDTAGEQQESKAPPPEKDPLDRLVIETCTSIDAILALLDAIFSPRASSSPSSSPKVALLVIDQLHRLFFDETKLAPLDGLTTSAIQAGLQKLCRQLVHHSRTKGMRVYLINGAMSSLPTFRNSSFGATTNRPSLGNAFGHMIDGTLWVARGNTVFPTVSTPTANVSDGEDPQEDRYQREVYAMARRGPGRLTSWEEDVGEQRLAMAVKAQGEGMRTHILEVIESSRGGKGRWTTYSSDGTVIIESPPI